MSTGSLFEPDLPAGFAYRDDFLAPDEETQLIQQIERIEFSTFEMHGTAARRRVAFYGSAYDAGRAVTLELPEFLLPLRDRLAAWAGLESQAFGMALINQYPAGAPIGWHRDAPQYEMVAGVSLLSACRMTFRPYVRPGARGSTPGIRRTATHEIMLARRSAYLMRGEARSAYEHHIPPVAELRYSVTFRTLR